MNARALPLRRALVVAAVACLALQLLAVGVFAPFALAPAVVVVAVAGGAAVFALHRAFAGLALAAGRLSEVARAEDWQRSLRVPALRGSGAYRELEGLRQRVLERVERSQQLREQAEQAANYKASFLRSVRHELRTPLNSILGFSDVLLSDLEGPLTADQRESLRMIRSEGTRLSELFDDVIELATVVSGQFRLEPVEIDLPALFERVAATHEAALSARLIHLRHEVTPTSLRLSADEERVRRVLMSLLGYALRVTTGHELRLLARPADGGVRVELVDGSRVLSPEELSSLIGERPPAHRRLGLEEGARLRLSICRQIVEMHGGRFVIDSGPKTGTRFALTLPRAADG